MQIPAAFDYVRADSVDHALQLLAEHGPEARVIAGGHSLLPMMKLRLANPEWLIDINDLSELDHITEDGDTLRVGALTRHVSLLESDAVAGHFPLVRDAETTIADPLVRNRGTIGGSLCQADPAEDLSTVCHVLRAELVIRGPNGERTVPMRELHRGPYETSVEQNEILTEIRWPIRPRSSSAYTKVERRVGDWATAAAGASVTMGADGQIEDVTIGLTAVGLDGSTATRSQDALRGQRPSEELYAEAGRLAAEDCNPVADQRGTEAYKRHLADELTRRVLRTAIERVTAGASPAGQGITASAEPRS
ncbi:MAG: xanthine dehydrogenase family protein subunit M [Geodermatophilaceae bacterium]|nr:xanthine dehydrogenase family protein subunit M [Geodermatophilaceae bacterium]MDQ3464598.1 xanthine dehydrogenase family protein subunit M [Actinomycetota bacterium]